MKLGLVLAGGGGKGSYEIGVWKYLQEIGLDKKISVIAGTSVGGLNAALMGCVEYTKAEKIWTTEIEGEILDTKSSIKRKGAIYSRAGLVKIIQNYISIDKLKNSEKQIYVTCYNVNELTPKYYKLNNYTYSEIEQLLCATSAIPVAFQNEKISGDVYIDGGIKDNIPLKPLLDEKCTHAIIVVLDDIYQDYSGFDIKAFTIHPSTKLGDFKSGTLDFNHERAKKRIQLGYNDCKKIYSKQIQYFTEDLMNKDENEELSKINEMNDKTVLLETLKILSVNPLYVGNIQCNMNAEMKTKGGKLWWNNIAEFGSWKFQQNKVSKHVRLLDELDNRRAWGSYDKMVGVCRNFLMQKAAKKL